jgi:hypothetical protein
LPAPLPCPAALLSFLQEYEKRLCMKDAEISACQAQLSSVQGQLDTLRRALSAMQRQVGFMVFKTGN